MTWWLLAQAVRGLGFQSQSLHITLASKTCSFVQLVLLYPWTDLFFEEVLLAGSGMVVAHPE